MSAHTPGPWAMTVEKRTPADTVFIKSASGTVVAHMTCPFGHKARRLADFRQMAAAPELLEAAKVAAGVLAELYAVYQTKIGPFASQAQKANVLLGAAIAKAEGA